MAIWQGKHLNKLEKIIIITSVFSFLAVLLMSLVLGLRYTFFGGSYFDYNDTVTGVILSMLLVSPALYVKRKANARLLQEGAEKSFELENIKKESETLAYAWNAIKGSLVLVIGIALIGLLVFLYIFLK